jgi:hypothetical protein
LEPSSVHIAHCATIFSLGFFYGVSFFGFPLMGSLFWVPFPVSGVLFLGFLFWVYFLGFLFGVFGFFFSTLSGDVNNSYIKNSTEHQLCLAHPCGAVNTFPKEPSDTLHVVRSFPILHLLDVRLSYYNCLKNSFALRV